MYNKNCYSAAAHPPLRRKNVRGVMVVGWLKRQREKPKIATEEKIESGVNHLE